MEVLRKQKIETDSLQEGDLLTIGGVQWVVIKVDGDDVTVQQYDHIEDHVFNEDNTNKYEGSDLQKYLEEYRKKFRSRALGEFYILPEDAYENGFLSDPKNRIRFDEDGYATCYWTSTPYVGLGYTVRTIIPSGYVHNHHAYSSYGVAPACKLNLASGIGTDRCREELKELLEKALELL